MRGRGFRDIHPRGRGLRDVRGGQGGDVRGDEDLVLLSLSAVITVSSREEGRSESQRVTLTFYPSLPLSFVYSLIYLLIYLFTLSFI